MYLQRLIYLPFGKSENVNAARRNKRVEGWTRPIVQGNQKWRRKKG